MDNEQKVVAPDGEETSVSWEKHPPGMNQAEQEEWESGEAKRRAAPKADGSPATEDVRVRWSAGHRPGLNQAAEEEWEARGGAPQGPPKAD